MRILVTGAAGFIGTNFVHHWVSRHPDDHVVALDALTYAGNLSNLDPVRDRVTFAHADIADAGDLLREHRIDVIVNFAAESHNSLAVLDPERFFKTNVLGTQKLLEAARRVGVARFHHVSTCEVYGDLALDDPRAFTEESPYRPRTPYNASKAGADHAVRAYHETFGLPATISNCANNYGPYQFPEKVIPLFITRVLCGLPLPVYESSANRREWLHVSDHCTAIEQVLLHGRVGETYNVGSGFEVSVAALAECILDHLGLPRTLIETVPDRPGHDRRYLLDSTKLRTETGWSPVIDFDAGLAATISWYRSNRDWWAPLLERSLVKEHAWTASSR
ncbi:dTDP-glucose 4,6-dehydratase [Allorhizocola rhizosphaerae]|uniref:dTDP-glucose 4,6-dehydratase n=1 Tax=Allorhizocola rhizosphaerae TaxID=1872709 RepID=UPI000E3D3934|nr:dTDP-glucose 4,6-dehydratase [Allorhizocola rhizosphaerae]